MKITQVDELKSVCQESNELLIYGAGRVAMTVIKYLSEFDICKPKSILVSVMGKNPDEVLGIPVITVADFKGNYNSATVLCCVMEDIQYELQEELAETEFINIYYLSDSLFRDLKYKIGTFDIDNYINIRKLFEQEEDTLKQILKFQKKPCLEYVIFNILDHCNLKCRGCDHFACIADQYFVKYESVRNDISRMSELFDGKYINKIAIMGGEPLLHPDLLKILKDARTFFPHAIIRLTTNGILLAQQKDEFWEVCNHYRITIVNTRYPLNLPYEQIEAKAKEKGVSFQYFEDTGKHIYKKSFKKNIDISGDGNPVENFAKCTISNYVNFIMEGKLYECPFSCQSYRIFNKKFGMNLMMTEQDYIDIYEVKDKEKILEFTAKPKNYCRYCTKGLTDNQPWSRSTGDISEWIDL